MPISPYFWRPLALADCALRAEIADGVLLSFIDPNATQDIVDRHLVGRLCQGGGALRT